MKAKELLRCIFNPVKQRNADNGNYAFAAKALCIAYIVFFVSTVVALRLFAADAFDEAAELLNETENFYMTNGRFYYEGDRFEKRVNSIGLNIILDPEGTPPTSCDGLTAYVGKDSGIIYYGTFKYEIVYRTLAGKPESVAFQKDMVTSYLSNGLSYAVNTVTSTAFFVGALFALILMMLVLFTALIVTLCCKFFGNGIDFGKRLFISASSFVYPLLVSAAVMLIPGGLVFTVGNFFLLLDICVAMVLIYVILAVYKKKSLNGQMEVLQNESVDN